jgi:GNAT superfamily N-acetyltransferase
VDELRVAVISSPDAVAAAGALFDDPVDLRATRAFLADESHHLLIAYISDRPVGFVTAVELRHPDKPQPEMFLYELGVDPEYQRRGVATALMGKLVALCHQLGCGEMFVLTDEGNDAAHATYAKAGGKPQPAGVMFHWDWRAPGR